MLRRHGHRQGGAGHDHGRFGLKQPFAQILGHVDGSGVQREVALRFAAALHPIDVARRALAQEDGNLPAQFLQAPVALGQFLGGVLVVHQFDQRADFLPHALHGQRQVVFHQIAMAHAHLAPAFSWPV